MNEINVLLNAPRLWTGIEGFPSTVLVKIFRWLSYHKHEVMTRYNIETID